MVTGSVVFGPAPALASQAPESHEDTFGFGIGAKRLAAMLREMADKLDGDKIFPQKLATAQIGDREDFVMHRFVLTYAEKK
jgi:hypothetical protein